MLKQAFAALGVVAAMATTSLAVVAPALAEEVSLERLEITAQPSVSELNNLQPQPTEVVTPETVEPSVVTIQPSISSLQPTEVPVRTIDEIQTLEPSRIETTSLEETVSEPSQVTTSDDIVSGYPLVIDLERPLTTPQPSDISSINPTTQIKVQPSSQPEPTGVEAMPRKTIERKTAKTITPHFPAQSTSTKFTFSKEQIVPALNVRDLEPSQVMNFSLDRPSDFLPTPQPTQIRTEPSQLLEPRLENAPPARPAPRHEGFPSVHEVTLANSVSNFSRGAPITTETNTTTANTIVPFTRQRVTRVTPISPVRVQPTVSRTQTLQKDVSRKASDLGGVVGLSSDAFSSVLPENPAVVERPTTATQKPTVQPTTTQLQKKPQSELTVSAGVVFETETLPKLETAVGFSYEGYVAKVRFDQPLRGEATLGIDSTLPLSDKASLTITADHLNTVPALSAKVEARVTEQLSTSVTLRDITTKPDVDLATQFQINERTRVGVSLTNLAAQLQVNIETAHKVSRHVEVNAKVDNLANPSVGLGIAVELTPQMKLELKANDVFDTPSYETKITHTFRF